MSQDKDNKLRDKTKTSEHGPITLHCALRHSGAGKLTYCAFFDKSTNFGTEVY